jgi:hypothetical protein
MNVQGKCQNRYKAHKEHFIKTSAIHICIIMLHYAFHIVTFLTFTMNSCKLSYGKTSTWKNPNC